MTAPADELKAAEERVRLGDPRIDISLRGPIADWLDETATEVTAAEGTEYELLAHEPGNSWTAALAVARQILGSTP